MGKMGAHAVIMGAGFGGLLPARVLADAYEMVTVTDPAAGPANPGRPGRVPILPERMS